MQAAENLSTTAEAHRLGNDWEALIDIWTPGVNLAVYHGGPTGPAEKFVRQEVLPRYDLAIRTTIDHPEALPALLPRALRDHPNAGPWIRELVVLVDAWSCLFGATRIGVRLTTLDSAMCPRFHVDRVPVRMLFTRGGRGSQWLHNEDVDRSVLGRPLRGAKDPLAHPERVRTLQAGDVALAKGELWPDNEGNGLVHRSPDLHAHERRLLLTFDPADC